MAECDLEEKEKHLVNQIVDQNDRMAFLIENLVKMSRLENGIVAVHPQMQDIALLMESLEGSYGNRIGKKIIFDPGYKEAGSVEAFYDLKWTVEAISNIIENALKYTDENGVIQISLKPYSSFTAVLVQDNGIGIAEEALKAIGMTERQIRRMVCMEGGYYAAGVILFSLVLGTLFSYVVIGNFVIFWFTTYRFIIWPMMMVLPFMVVIGVVVPYITIKVTDKESVVEMLREE